MPEQSSGGALPPEFCTAVQIVGESTHCVPPRNGAFLGLKPQYMIPDLLLITCEHVRWKSSGAPSVGSPVQFISASQPWLLVFDEQ